MKLILVRHGHAPHREGKRSLSERGEEEVRALAEYLNQKGFLPERIFHSDLLRAEQTARLLQESCTDIPLEISEDLRPESPVSHWHERLNDWRENLMLVGHMPYMPIMAKTLIDQWMDFPTAQAVILEKKAQNWTLINRSWP